MKRSHIPSIALAVLLVAPALAVAKTYEPTRKDDPIPGKCKANNCSLREAVIAANRKHNKDTIKLKGGTYQLEIPTGGMVQDDLIGDLDLEGRTTVVGRGSTRTTVDGNDHDRVFEIVRPSTLRAMTVTDGSAADGGGIYVSLPGNARLDGLVVSGNTASDDGGGVFSQAGLVEIIRTSIGLNSAGISGGGLASHEVAKVAEAPRTRLLRSAVWTNSSSGTGGGIALTGTPMTSNVAPVLEAVNSTIAKNGSALNGGGISATFGGAEANLDNVTVSGNTSDTDINDSGDGGGLHEFAGEINSFDSIIAGNGAPSESSPGAQCLGDFVGDTSILQNQVAPPDGCFVIGFTATDDPKLEVLQDNGGPTPTAALLTGSPAIGIVSDCPKVDQRGKRRPRTGCDGGAFERKGP